MGIKQRQLNNITPCRRRTEGSKYQQVFCAPEPLQLREIPQMFGLEAHGSNLESRRQPIDPTAQVCTPRLNLLKPRHHAPPARA